MQLMGVPVVQTTFTPWVLFYSLFIRKFYFAALVCVCYSSWSQGFTAASQRNAALLVLHKEYVFVVGFEWWFFFSFLLLETLLYLLCT